MRAWRCPFAPRGRCLFWRANRPAICPRKRFAFGDDPAMARPMKCKQCAAVSGVTAARREGASGVVGLVRVAASPQAPPVRTSTPRCARRHRWEPLIQRTSHLCTWLRRMRQVSAVQACTRSEGELWPMRGAPSTKRRGVLDMIVPNSTFSGWSSRHSCTSMMFIPRA